MSNCFWFSNTQWSRIAPHLPRNDQGARRVDDRGVLSGVVHVLKSGGRWADAPSAYWPKRRFTIGSCTGPNAGSGRISLRHLPVMRVSQIA